MKYINNILGMLVYNISQLNIGDKPIHFMWEGISGKWQIIIAKMPDDQIKAA